MEANGAIVQGGGGGTLLCTPSDSLTDDKRLKKRSRRLLVSDCGSESYNNAKRCGAPSSTTFSFKLAADSGKNFHKRLVTTANSLDSSVNSSGMPDPEPCHQSKHESWEFETLAACSCKSPSLLSSDVIGTIDFDDSGKLVAIGGLARKIRICSYQQLVSGMEKTCLLQVSSVKNLFTTICMPAKLSSLKWRPGSSEVIACGDYDGSVTEWDVEHGATVSERYEHTGKTVWSIDYSSDLLASASSDSTVRFWSRNVEGSVGIINSVKGNSMCCVEFGRFSSPGRYVAVACADATVYLYDMRSLGSPVLSLRGHQRSVSYVRWLGESNLVSSSPDGTIRLWDIASTISSGESYRRNEDPLLRTFDSHSNAKNFVGLSVAGSSLSGWLIACGSENNEVFVYSYSVDRPVFRHKFPSDNTAVVQDAKAFVGSVCWTKQEDHLSLISANSEGIVQVIRASSTDTRECC